MKNIRAMARLANGDEEDWTPDASDLARFLQRESEGLTGRALVYKTLRDDWDAPPVTVVIRWTDEHGAAHERRIDCTVPAKRTHRRG